MKIILDAMGGDNAPLEILKGAVDAVNEFDVEIVLVGDKHRIDAVASENNIDISKFEIIHTSVSVGMDDDPMTVLRTKKESSMCVGLRMVAAGEGNAFVSAGNTGALFTAASLIVRKIPGIQRAAIASILPMQPPVLLLDSGANINVTDEYIEQFAIMGNVYMKSIFGLELPRIGLLNNGAESSKGTQLQLDAYQRLSLNSDLNFVGNIEANKVPFDSCDVLVTDGFTGNILLKSIEGMGKLMIKTLKDTFSKNLRTKASYLMIKDQVGEIRKNFDSSTYGGAPMLGLKKPVIKAHGSSKARAIKNAIRQAMNYSETNVTGAVSREILRLTDKRKTMLETENAVDHDGADDAK